MGPQAQFSVVGGVTFFYDGVIFYSVSLFLLAYYGHVNHNKKAVTITKIDFLFRYSLTTYQTCFLII